MKYFLGILLILIVVLLIWIDREWRKDWMPGIEGLDDGEDN